MNKALIQKWGKRAGIAIGGVVAIFILCIGFAFGYQELYIPHHIESLYKEGLSNPNKAEWAVKQLQNIADMEGVHQEKALALIKEYAQKENLWAQVALEKYNEEHEIPIKSIVSINKHIWGITLGKSTKQDVWNYLDSKGLWHQELKNGEITQIYKEFEFAGVYWDYVNYHFTSNKVYKITFICNVKGSAKEYFDRLKDMLVSKYTLSKKNNTSSPLKFYIKDSHVLIELELDYNTLYFRYIDLKAKKGKYQKDLSSI